MLLIYPPPYLAFAIFCLLGLGSLSTAWAQAPANDNPCGAVVLPLLGGLCTSPTTSTNVNATTTVPNGYGNSGSPKDVWFRFTTAASGPASFGATITVTGNPAGFVQLFSATAAGCTGALTSIDFSPNPASTTSGAPNTAAPRLITGLLVPSSTYYVRVAGFTDNDFTGPFTVCVTDGPGTPTCGNPGVAIAYPNGVPTLSFAAGVNIVPPYAVVLATNNQPNQTFSSPTGAPVALPGLVPGTTYTATVTANCPSGGQGTSVLQFVVPIVNDEPCGAISLPLNGMVCNPVSASNGPATASVAANQLQSSTCPGFLNGPARDVWFTVTTAASGTGSTTLNVATTGPAATRIRLLQASSCNGPFTIVGCAVNGDINPSSSSTTLLTASALSPNSTYYVLIDQAGQFNAGTAGTFTICAATSPPCAAPGNVNVQSIGTTTAQVGFNAPFGVTAPPSYAVTYTPQGGTTTTLVVTSAGVVNLSGLTPGTAYSVCVASNCASGGQSPPVCRPFTTTAVVACAAPTGLSVTNVTNTSASLAFGPAASATGYVVTVTPPGGPIQTLSPNPTASPVALTGLQPGITYTVTMQTVCAAGLGAVVSTTFTTTSTGIVQYCTSGLGGNCGGPIISGVSIPTTTLNNLGTTCATANNSAYTAYPATGNTTATLVQGQAYQYRVTPDVNNPADIVAWIDFNQNGLFEASEGTQVGLNVNPNQAATAAFTVPATAAVGRTGMRVRCRLAGSGLTPADACVTVGSGETEDYAVTISLPSSARESILAAMVSLSPNPARHAATLVVPAALLRQTVKITVLSVVGQTVHHAVAPAARADAHLTLDVANLPAGLYFVQLVTDQGALIKRLLVE